RMAVGAASPYVSVPHRSGTAQAIEELVEVARRGGRGGGPLARPLLAPAEMTGGGRGPLPQGVRAGAATRHISRPARLLPRPFEGLARAERASITFELAGPDALMFDSPGDRRAGMEYVQRQRSCIGGGTTEMARNIISERIMGMPRERTPDKDIPFSDVPR